MRKTKIEIALPVINNYFDESSKKIFKLKELYSYLVENRHNWDLAKATTSTSLINFLIENSKMKKVELPFPNRNETRYVWGEINLYEVLLTLHSNSYFSHHTAMYLNGLTDATPPVIYLNQEQSPKPETGYMSQKGIDFAFRSKPRLTNNIIDNDKFKICMINGKHTNQLGVTSKLLNSKIKVKITNVERTLIDIVVRPFYSGGDVAIKLAFAKAKDTFSVESLRDLYLKLKYQYPYHQAIGYYLENAYYSHQSIKLFENLPMEFDFYLENQMKKPIYVEKWKLFVPNSEH